MVVIGNKIGNKPIVYFIGLSAKPKCEHLSPVTRTGNIIERIINHLPNINAIKTNLVKFPPIDLSGKLRYPNQTEMQLGFDELSDDMSQTPPHLLVTLGQQVSVYLRSKMGVLPAKPQLTSDFSSDSYLAQSQSNILSIHHPSFVYVYRRKYIESYVDNVVRSISTLTAVDGNGPLCNKKNHNRADTIRDWNQN